MRDQIVLMTLLALPAEVAAHDGPHGLHGLEWLTHLAGQHGMTVLAGALVSGLLLAWHCGVRQRTSQAGIRPGVRRG